MEDPRQRARRLDEALSRLSGFWSGAFEPLPVQRPRIPVWVAAVWPHRRPSKRALRWDGLFPIELPGPEALAELADEIERSRHGGLAKFDLVVEIGAGEASEPWHQAGATWVLTEFGMQPRAAQVLKVVKAGPE